MNEKRKMGKNKRPVSIDGFVSDGRLLGGSRAKTHQPGTAAGLRPLGSFDKRPDGFQPMRQSGDELVYPTAGAPNPATPSLDEPILLDQKALDKPTKGKDQSPRRKKWFKIGKRTGLALAALLIIAGLYFALKIYITDKHLFRGGGQAAALSSQVDINQLKGEGDGRVNILLLGIGGPGHDGPDLTDTIMVASIDPVNNKVDLLSVPRDLWVKIPGNGYQKINAAYPDGKMESKAKNLAGQEKDGLKLLDQTIEPVLGININYHVVVDFQAFKDVVDNLGGISVNVPEELYDPTIAWENGYNSVIAKPGVQTFNGQKALLYVKSRETSSDFARAERQRLVMVAIKDKVFSAGTFANPVKISNLLSSLGNNVFTDFSSSEIPRVYQLVKQVPSQSINSLDLVTPPHNFLTTANINGLSVVEPRAGLFEYTDIQNYVRNALRDGFIAKENANLAVYNATDTASLAATVATQLKSYGYNVPTTGNTSSATNPATTTLVDLTQGKDKYTRHYLEQRFKVTAASKVPATSGITPPAGTSFVIILGKDASTAF